MWQKSYIIRSTLDILKASLVKQKLTLEVYLLDLKRLLDFYVVFRLRLRTTLRAN